jgi:hypothetical protein
MASGPAVLDVANSYVPQIEIGAKSNRAVDEPDAPAFNENSQPHFLLTRYVSQSSTFFACRAVIGGVIMCVITSLVQFLMSFSQSQSAARYSQHHIGPRQLLGVLGWHIIPCQQSLLGLGKNGMVPVVRWEISMFGIPCTMYSTFPFGVIIFMAEALLPSILFRSGAIPPILRRKNSSAYYPCQSVSIFKVSHIIRHELATPLSLSF